MRNKRNSTCPETHQEQIGAELRWGQAESSGALQVGDAEATCLCTAQCGLATWNHDRLWLHSWMTMNQQKEAKVHCYEKLEWELFNTWSINFLAYFDICRHPPIQVTPLMAVIYEWIRGKIIYILHISWHTPTQNFCDNCFFFYILWLNYT
jgi:hypothetical protein